MRDVMLRDLKSHANWFLGIVTGLACIGGLVSDPLRAQTITSIVNAASGSAGGVSPGEIVVISGTSLGPATLVAAPIAGATVLPVMLGGVNVTFNGIAAPMIYASAVQTSVQVPYAMAGAGSAAVKVSNGSATSPAFNVAVVDNAPGLFTLNYSGSGPVVALNFGSINSAQNPVAPGSSIILFATGEGVTTPAGVYGAIQTNSTVHAPNQPISVHIGGAAAQVLFSSSVSGNLAGIVEIGVVVPASLPSLPAAPVTLTIGGVTTSQLTTLAVHR
jgi:trimeric autotransporter adhesin